MTVRELRAALRSMPADAPVEMLVGAASVEVDQASCEAFSHEGVVVQLWSFDRDAGRAVAGLQRAAS